VAVIKPLLYVLCQPSDFAGILRDLGGDVKKKHPCKISIF